MLNLSNFVVFNFSQSKSLISRCLSHLHFSRHLFCLCSCSFIVMFNSKYMEYGFYFLHRFVFGAWNNDCKHFRLLSTPHGSSCLTDIFLYRFQAWKMCALDSNILFYFITFVVVIKNLFFMLFFVFYTVTITLIGHNNHQLLYVLIYHPISVFFLCSESRVVDTHTHSSEMKCRSSTLH